MTCPICNGMGTYRGGELDPPEPCGYCGEEGDGHCSFRMWLHYRLVTGLSWLLLPKELQ